jgi:2-methylisocitrate lyase-like PEP mutase family enzyme
MEVKAQIERAKRLRALHQGPEVLLLPNIWDPLGARLLEHLGYPAVATSSAAVACSMGSEDGERIPFEAMCERIARIAESVELPVTADIEAGYAERPEEVARNIRLVLRAGAVGINLEDGAAEGGPLHPIELQCARIRAVREMAAAERIPLFINARTDLYVGHAEMDPETKLAETAVRARAYREAGADCVYPILLTDRDAIIRLQQETGGPLNILATPSTPPLADLKAIGVRRLSLGSGFQRAALATMRNVALALRESGTYETFTQGVMMPGEVAEIVKGSRHAADAQVSDRSWPPSG